MFIDGEPMKPGHEHVDRMREQLPRCGALLQHAVVQHGDAVAHRHRLDLVVGDVDGRHAEAPLQRGDLRAGLDAELGVEVRQRLVHQEDLRLAHDRPPHRHPLALTARQLGRLAVEVLLEVEDARRLLDPRRPLLLADLLHLEVEADVLGDGHVRVQRVRLEDHRDVAVLRLHRRDVVVADAGSSRRRSVRGRRACATWSTSRTPTGRRAPGTRRRRWPGRGRRPPAIPAPDRSASLDRRSRWPRPAPYPAPDAMSERPPVGLRSSRGSPVAMSERPTCRSVGSSLGGHGVRARPRKRTGGSPSSSS